MTSLFLMGRMSKILRQQPCVCLFFLPPAVFPQDCTCQHVEAPESYGDSDFKPQVFKYDLYVLYNVQFVTF